MYNVFERQLARWLNRFPALKSFIKQLYQAFNFIIYRKKYEVYTHFQLFPLLDRESFFGYYDKSPENRTGEYVIFHASPFPTTKNRLQVNLLLLFYTTCKKKQCFDHGILLPTIGSKVPKFNGLMIINLFLMIMTPLKISLLQN